MYKNNTKTEVTGKVFPAISNQKLNSYLKEIAEVCDIEKTLTFHLARHTFATTVTLTNGVPTFSPDAINPEIVAVTPVVAPVY